MKLTKRQLKRIIKEEKLKLLRESVSVDWSDEDEMYVISNNMDDMLGITYEEIGQLITQLQQIKDQGPPGVWSDEKDYDAGWRR